MGKLDAVCATVRAHDESIRVGSAKCLVIAEEYEVSNLVKKESCRQAKSRFKDMCQWEA